MNKGPKNITMLDVLDAIHDFDGRDLFNSIATERSNGPSDYTVKLVNSITLGSLNLLNQT